MPTIGGVKINGHIMNAACSVTRTFEDVESMCATKAGAVLIGSVTLKPRSINTGPNLETGEYYSLNSFGMPNKGLAYYRKSLPKMVEMIHGSKKKAVLSIAGFSADDYEKLAELGDLVDLLELNLGCPNAHDEINEIISFNPQLIEQIITAVKSVTKTPLFVKLSPYSNPAQLVEVAGFLVEHKVAAVVTSNTFPNGLFKGVQDSYAGISGKALKPIAIGQVHQFRKLLPASMSVVGVGGIESAYDVKDYLEAGADLVQVATLIVRDGHSAIDRLV